MVRLIKRSNQFKSDNCSRFDVKVEAIVFSGTVNRNFRVFKSRSISAKELLKITRYRGIGRAIKTVIFSPTSFLSTKRPKLVNSNYCYWSESVLIVN